MIFFLMWIVMMITIYFVSFKEDFNEEDFGKAAIFYGIGLAVVGLITIGSIVVSILN